MAISAPCTVHPITTETQFQTHTSQLPTECLTVIYFHAPWAEPCKQMSTILTTLASTHEATTPPRIAFLALDAEEVPEISEQYDVTQVPLIVLQKGGQVVDSVMGTDANKVRNAIDAQMGGAGPAGGNKSALPPAQQVTKPEGSKADAVVNGGANGQKLDEAPETSPEELNARLSDLVKAAPVMLFMKGTPSAPQCGFSRQTVAMLRERNIRYGFFNILADDEVRQGLKEFSEWPTFPQLYVDGEFQGGLDIVKEEFENDPDFLKQYAVAPKAAAA